MDSSDHNAKTATTAVPTPESGEHKDAQKHRTVGNIIYDVGIFGSIAWGGVALLSALSAHEAMHGNHKMFGWLRSLNNAAISGFTKLFSKTVLNNAPKETIEGYAKGTAMFLTLGMGGNALMAPLKWMEDNRQKNAARIDNLLGTTPPDPETIAHEPKQTWKSVLSGRMLSWGTSYTAFVAMGPKITGKLNGFFKEAATNSWMRLRPTSNREKITRWADIAAFDALFTAITASITYVFSRYVAAKDEAAHPETPPVIEENPQPSYESAPHATLAHHKPKQAESFVQRVQHQEPAATTAMAL